MLAGMQPTDSKKPKPPIVIQPHSSLSGTIWPSALVYRTRESVVPWKHGIMSRGENGVKLCLKVGGKEMSETLTVMLSVAEVQKMDNRPVGDSPGRTGFDVRKDEAVRLDLNITNSRGDAFTAVKAEWLVFTGTVGGVQLPVFVLTSGGQIFDIRNVSDFNAVTYSFNHTGDVATLATLALGALGFKAGDTFVYGYAYTTSDVSKFVFDNAVTLNIR